MAINYNTGEYYSNEEAQVSVVKIPIAAIVDRDKNDFEAISNYTLKESIKNYGVIHPIAVIVREKDFQLISGHRRLAVVRQLHKEFPDNREYRFIDATVHEVVEDNDPRLGTGPRFITKNQEEQMYRDANFEVRQVTFADGLGHLEYIIHKIRTSEAYKKEAIKQVGAINGKVRRVPTKVNEAKLLSHVLTNDLKYPNFSVSNVRRILAILDCPSGKEELMKIKNGEESVGSVYFRLYPEERKSKTTCKKMSYVAIRNELDDILNSVTEYGADEGDMEYISEISELTFKLRKQLNKISYNLIDDE